MEIFFRLARDLEIFDGISYAQKIKCPVLMIGGENDLIVPPSEFDWYAKYLKDPRIVIMPNGSHCPHLDDPQFVNQALEHFYSSMS